MNPGPRFWRSALWVYARYDNRSDQSAGLESPWGLKPALYRWPARTARSCSGTLGDRSRARLDRTRQRHSTYLHERHARGPRRHSRAGRSGGGVSADRIRRADEDGGLCRFAVFPRPASGDGGEIKWVVPENSSISFLSARRCPAPPGEEAIHANFRRLMNAAPADPAIAKRPQKQRSLRSARSWLPSSGLAIMGRERATIGTVRAMAPNSVSTISRALARRSRTCSKTR